MANKNLFQSIVGRFLPKTNVVNEAGGNAYAFGPEHALAQLAATGCLNATFGTSDFLPSLVRSRDASTKGGAPAS